MKSPDLPLHYSNSFQRSFCCPKYSREISPRSPFTLQHREQLVLMALNRSPYDARVTPPEELSGRDHLPRLHSSRPVTPCGCAPGGDGVGLSTATPQGELEGNELRGCSWGCALGLGHLVPVHLGSVPYTHTAPFCVALWQGGTG